MWILLTFVDVVIKPVEDVFDVPPSAVDTFFVVLICKLIVALLSVAEVTWVDGIISDDVLFIVLVAFVVSLLCLLVPIVFVEGSIEVGLCASFTVVSAPELCSIFETVFADIVVGEDEPVSGSMEVAGQ